MSSVPLRYVPNKLTKKDKKNIKKELKKYQKIIQARYLLYS